QSPQSRISGFCIACVPICSFIAKRRSRWGVLRGWPVLSSHFSPGFAPQVGQRGIGLTRVLPIPTVCHVKRSETVPLCSLRLETSFALAVAIAKRRVWGAEPLPKKVHSLHPHGAVKAPATEPSCRPCPLSGQTHVDFIKHIFEANV